MKLNWALRCIYASVITGIFGLLIEFGVSTKTLLAFAIAFFIFGAVLVYLAWREEFRK